MAHLEMSDAGIKLSGHLTFLNLPELKKRGHQLLDSLSPSHCEIDCGEIAKMNSAGLALLLSWMRHAKKQGKTVAFLNAQSVVKTMASLYALDSILIFQD